MTAWPTDDLASAERRIQELTKELSQARGELAESREQQAATANILAAISNASTDMRAVFDVILDNACRLCASDLAGVFRFDGKLIYLEVTKNWSAEALARGAGQYPMLLDSQKVSSRVVLTKNVVLVEDILTDASYEHSTARVGGWRRMLGVPILRNGDAIGAIVVTWREPGPISSSQVDLLQTFADQAVIAIENTRLFEAERTRTQELTERSRELTEALEYQTATGNVLGVISRSKFDLQPVLESVVKTAVRLCRADHAMIYRLSEGTYQFAASYGPYNPEYLEIERNERIPPGRGTLVGRTALAKSAVQIVDVLVDPHYEKKDDARIAKVRSILGVPLLRDGEAIGVIGLGRNRVEPYSEREVKLVAAFADQAVIAIEDTRLFEEVQARTRELAKTVEDLEIASQHKNQFVANMSHELRTPLAAILGYAELMQEGFYGNQSKKSLNALTRIRSNGKHLLGLINTVLDIAKIESGQFTLNMAEYAIESVVETVRSATESLAQNKKLALKTEVAKSLPVGLGDEQRLTQVLLNLVGNALKFTDTGEVRVTAKAVNGHFNVSVTDTGPGIPEEHQARIFEQFHQVDSSNTKAKGGTGLGLAIAKQIVEMHGGRIWVESALGKGSTFQMELPTRAEFRKRAA
jgi:signal transduction histidine kinase